MNNDEQKALIKEHGSGQEFGDEHGNGFGNGLQFQTPKTLDDHNPYLIIKNS